MKNLILTLLILTSYLSANYTLTPDGTYVSGDSYSVAPDGTFVGGSNFEMTPDGKFIGTQDSNNYDTDSVEPAEPTED